MRDLDILSSGPVSIHSLTDAVLKRGILSDEELRCCQARGVGDLCRASLKEQDESGIPFAQPVPGSDTGEWKRLSLFTPDEFGALIAERVKSLRADYDALRRLHSYCEMKFGVGAEIPELVAPVET